MKVILDVTDLADLNTAMQAILQVMQRVPNQKEGDSITVAQGGKAVVVSRNKESYTGQIR